MKERQQQHQQQQQPPHQQQQPLHQQQQQQQFFTYAPDSRAQPSAAPQGFSRAFPAPSAGPHHPTPAVQESTFFPAQKPTLRARPGGVAMATGSGADGVWRKGDVFGGGGGAPPPAYGQHQQQHFGAGALGTVPGFTGIFGRPSAGEGQQQPWVGGVTSQPAKPTQAGSSGHPPAEAMPAGSSGYPPADSSSGLWRPVSGLPRDPLSQRMPPAAFGSGLLATSVGGGGPPSSSAAQASGLGAGEGGGVSGGGVVGGGVGWPGNTAGQPSSVPPYPFAAAAVSSSWPVSAPGPVPARSAFPATSLSLSSSSSAAFAHARPLFSSLPQPPTSELNGREFPLPPFSSLPSHGPFQPARVAGKGLTDTGDNRPIPYPPSGLGSGLGLGLGLGQPQGLSEPVGPVSASLAARLASGLSEEERVQRLRDYQRQLVDKHQERMRSLQDVRARIETRQADSATAGRSETSFSSSLSSSQRLADPASLVPYTLRTSVLASAEESATTTTTTVPGSSSLQPAAATTTAMPMSAASLSSSAQLASTGASGRVYAAAGVSGLFATLGGGGGGGWGAGGGVPGLFSGAAGTAGLLSSSAAVEPILAGSAGVAVAPTTTTSKLDSVRRSLPFDGNPDDTLPGREADADANDISLADDSHISSSTDRGSPALGSRSNKSSTSGVSGKSGVSGVSGKSGSAASDGSLGGSSLVARAEEKRLSFEQRQRELHVQLAEIQRQKDALLQRYHGNQQRVSGREEDLRQKLRAAQQQQQATTSSSLSLSSSREPGPPPRSPASSRQEQPLAAALSLGVHHHHHQGRQSGSPSMELEEGSLSSGRRSGPRSWAMELEEFSLQDRSGDRAYRSPGSMTLEEVSITSDWSGGGGGGPAVAAAADRSSGGARPGSSLSSLEEFSILSGGNGRHPADAEGGRGPLSARGSQENLQRVEPESEAGTLTRARPEQAAGRLDVGDLLQDLQHPEGLPGLQTPTGDADSARLPPPPTRQPIPVAEYQPHELSTILEVDTPQTAAKVSTTAAAGDDGGDRAAARRHIEFGRRGSLPDEDRGSESKFSASGSSASSDVRSVIEVRPGMLRLGGAGTTTTTTTTAAAAEGRGGGGVGAPALSEKGEETLFRENVPDSSTMKAAASAAAALFPPSSSSSFSFPISGQNPGSLAGQGSLGTLAGQGSLGSLAGQGSLGSLAGQGSLGSLAGLGSHAGQGSLGSLAGQGSLGSHAGQGSLGSRLPAGQADASASSSSSGLQGFQTLEWTLDSLTPRSLSVEDSRARRYLDFSGEEEGATGGGPASSSASAVVGGGGGGSGDERVGEVMRQARQFNQDLMDAIQRQSADVFDQSSSVSSTLSRAPADSSRDSQL